LRGHGAGGFLAGLLALSNCLGAASKKLAEDA
jgi:hypothetical protein